MNKDSKRRNVIITVFLWLTILVNLAMTVGFIVSMYAANAMEETLGLGLCSMFTFANVLGAILLMRWNKYGLGLTVVSVSLLSIVYAYVLNIGLIPTLPFIGAVAILWLILQILKDGKSAWSQLKSGWDSRHCRHIYQIFAVVELILFILTLVAFGSNKGKEPNTEPSPVLQDTIVVEKQNPVENNSRDSIPVADSVRSESPDFKNPTGQAEKPKSDGDKDITEKNSENTYSLEDAVRYLDIHEVWHISEMNKYPDLRQLDVYLRNSLHSCHDMLPSNLASKSKRLHEIRMLLREVEHLSISNDERIMSRLRSKSHRGISTDIIEPNFIRKSLRETIQKARSYERSKKSSGDKSTKTPSDEKRVKKRSIGGDSPVDSVVIRKKKKRLEKYKKMVSDSIESETPTFGLG